VSVALITGGALRIGASITRRMAQAGYAVIIHANTSRAAAEILAEEITNKGGKAAIVPHDLADLPALPAFYARACEPFGAPDVLINNASLFAKDRLGAVDAATFSANLAVNLQAPVLLAQAFAAHLPEGREGAIINLLDQRVLRVTPQFFSYTLAKSALYTATKTLAQALAPRIRVNGVGPGPTLPNIHDGAEGFMQEAAGTLLGRAISPEEIAEAVLFLVQAKGVTGQMLAVDSGQHLGWQTPDIVE
jgi:NAD(P)-dependent dehydrogenase (short-subunit alcohol dehydrogenase family)